ncbi:hypothetical protein CDD83_7733 [Cordyceps sp. RAO-2017]|nr:hypothetical protein CDD83_7733 [Cordyceps sp. RAO-2017]
MWVSTGLSTGNSHAQGDGTINGAARSKVRERRLGHNDISGQFYKICLPKISKIRQSLKGGTNLDALPFFSFRCNLLLLGLGILKKLASLLLQTDLPTRAGPSSRLAPHAGGLAGAIPRMLHLVQYFHVVRPSLLRGPDSSRTRIFRRSTREVEPPSGEGGLTGVAGGAAVAVAAVITVFVVGTARGLLVLVMVAVGAQLARPLGVSRGRPGRACPCRWRAALPGINKGGRAPDMSSEPSLPRSISESVLLMLPSCLAFQMYVYTKSRNRSKVVADLSAGSNSQTVGKSFMVDCQLLGEVRSMIDLHRRLGHPRTERLYRPLTNADHDNVAEKLLDNVRRICH